MDTREAAQEAARRAGMSLGEWLDTIIADEAEAMGIAPEDIGDDDRLEAVTARLSQMAGAPRQPRRRARAERPAPRVRRSEAEREDDDFERLPRRARAAPVQSIDAEAMLDAAISAMEQRSARSERKTQIVLDTVASRLADIEERIEDRSGEDNYRPIKSALARLEERLEDAVERIDRAPAPAAPDTDGHFARLEARIGALAETMKSACAPQPAPAPQFIRAPRPLAPRAPLRDQVAEIQQRQRMLDQPVEAAPARPAADFPAPSLADLDRRLEQMAARIEKTTAAALTSHRADDRGFAGLHGEISKLAARLEAMGEDRRRRPEPPPELSMLRDDVADLSRGLADLAPRGSVAALESAVRDLAARVDASRGEGVRDSLLEPVERLAADLRSSLQTLNPAATVDALDREIKVIGRKVETMTLSGFDPEAFARIHAQTQEIRDLLATAAHKPLPLDKIERQIADLATRVDQLAGQGAPPADDHLTRAVGEIRSLLYSSLGRHNLLGLEKRIEALAAKIDQSITAAPAPAASADLGGIEKMMQQFAGRIEEGRGAGQGAEAFEALQKQIARLDGRLDRSDASLASLGAIERAIGDLFDRIDKTQTAAPAAPEAGLIKRDLADLRAMQDVADQRTHSTLSAVHETLEKVVDRLALLEDDISQARPSDPGAPSARAETPVFAPPEEAEKKPPLNLKSASQETLSKAEAVRSVNDAVREARAQLSAPRLEAKTAPAIRAADPNDLLIEPGSGSPTGRAAASSDAFAAARQALTGAAEDAGAESRPATRESFIAAARRAHIAVASESAPRLPGDAAPDADAPDNAIGAVTGRVRAFVAARKRPLLIGLTGLTVALGAVMVARSLLGSPAPVEKISAPAQTSSALPAAAVQPEAAPALPLPVQAESLPARKPSASLTQQQSSPGAPGIDRTATGAISGKSAPAETASLDPAAAALAPTLRDAVLSGNAAAQYEFATRLAEGRGAARDLKAAAIWFEKAAGQGLAPAQYRLGSLYEKGLGVARDPALARAWYQRAADKGNARAMHNLAVLTAEGAGGKPDYAAAAGWFKKAAEYGIRDSQYNLAILYARGLGIEQNLTQSYVWFAAGAAQGDEDAAKKRDEVAAKFDAKTLAQARAAAEAFRAKTPDLAANEVAAPAGGWDAPPAKTEPKPKAKVSTL